VNIVTFADCSQENPLKARGRHETIDNEDVDGGKLG
jgi:hypothetical protein